MHKKLKKQDRLALPFFIKDLFMRTDLIFKTDKQKLPGIINTLQSFRHDMSIGNKETIFLHHDCILTLEQMQGRKFLPAFPPLIAYYCTMNNPQSPTILVKLLEDARASVNQPGQLCQQQIISESTLHHLLNYYTLNPASLDPLYKYTQLLLESFITTPEATHSHFEAVPQIIEFIIADIKVKKEKTAYRKQSQARIDFIKQLEAFFADNSAIARIKGTEFHQHLIDLYYLFNPDVKQKIHKIASQGADILLSTLLSPGNVSDFQTDTMQLDLSSIDSNFEKRKSSRKQLTELRKNGNFEEYKQRFQNKQLNLLEDDQPATPMSKIDNYLLQMGHEYLLAQADSKEPVDPLEVKRIQALIEEAIATHPFYAYATLAFEFINDNFWPVNIQKGTGFLSRATLWATGNQEKMNLQDKLFLNNVSTHFNSLKNLNAQSINPSVNKVVSEKII